MDGFDELNDQAPTPRDLPVAAKRSRRGPIIAGVAVVAVLLVGGAAFAFQTLVGGPLSSAEAIPADAHIVVTVDALQLIEEGRLEALVDAFMEPAVAGGLIEPGDPQSYRDILSDIDAEATGSVTLDDVGSFIGRTATAAFWIDADLFEADLYETAEPDWMVSMMVRDMDAAESVLSKLVSNGEAESSDLNGITVYTESANLEGGSEEAVVALYDRRMLMASSAELLNRSIATIDNGGSIADDGQFRATTDLLPDDRFVTFYTESGWIKDLIEQASDDLIGDTNLSEIVAFEEIAVSFGLIEAGLRIDSVATSADGTSTPTSGPTDWVRRLPTDTLGFVGATGGTSGNPWSAYGGDTQAEMQDALAEISDEVGFDIEAVLEHLTGEAVFAIAASNEGLVGAEAGVGIVAGIGFDDREAIAAPLETLEDLLSEEGVEISPDQGLRVVHFEQDQIAAWSVTDEGLFVGSDPDLVRAVAGSDDGGIVYAPLYVFLDEAMPGDGLMAYWDADATIDLIYDKMELTDDDALAVRDVLRPLRGVGVSGFTVEGVSRSTFLIAIDY